MFKEKQFSSEEERLKNALEQYKKIIEETPICIKVFDNKGKLTFINKGGRKEHSIKDDEDLSKWDWLGTIKKEYQLKVKEAFEKGLKGVETRLLTEHTPEGSDHQWCEGIISPIKNEGGEVVLLLFYSVDVNERELAKKKLLEEYEAMEIKNQELNKINHYMVGRELKMTELKDELDKMRKNQDTI
ncbi:MAG: PAS domain-containing protein [Minisyncoccota bacterium]